MLQLGASLHIPRPLASPKGVGLTIWVSVGAVSFRKSADNVGCGCVDMKTNMLIGKVLIHGKMKCCFCRAFFFHSFSMEPCESIIKSAPFVLPLSKYLLLCGLKGFNCSHPRYRSVPMLLSCGCILHPKPLLNVCAARTTVEGDRAFLSRPSL